MEYNDYLRNAEKHYMYCKETMSIEWERRFLEELFLYIKGKSQFYLGKYNVEYFVNKVKDSTSNALDVDKLGEKLVNLVENSNYDDFSLNGINYYDTLTNNRAKCESEWIKPLQRRLTEIYEIFKSYIKDTELMKTISEDLHKATNDYKKKIETKFKEQQRKLFYIYLNTFYISGYIYEGIAMFSILKLLGYKDTNLPSSLKDLGKSEYYDEQRLKKFVEDDLQEKFGDLITTHDFNEYINIVRGNNSGLNFEQQNIEFVGQEIKDNTLKMMVNNWSPKVRYKQFDDKNLFCIPNTTVNIKKNDIEKLLELSEAIIKNVKDNIKQ